MKDKLIIYSLIVAFLGFLDATYLTIVHYKNIIPPCSITSGCETVLTSKFASVAGIPVALLGSLFYIAVMIFCLLILTNYKKIFLQGFYALVGIGFIVSLILIYIQRVILHAFCQYCLLSEAVSAGLVALAYLKFKADKKGV
ncbi:MAG TPA: vitamin K epoxide reductase family protein [Candidatus Sulfotelmatobacter sp.]|nr:vitamin K epoxide reductase family protein [Candidatus Sulfotelmatobacter sp.]